MARKYGNSQIEFNGQTYISVEILAEKTGYSAHSIRHMARAGKLPTVKFGHRWMFNLKDVMAAIAPKLEEAPDASTASATCSPLLARI